MLECEKDESKTVGYNAKKGLLYKDRRLVIPKRSPFIPKLLAQLYSSAIGGHERALKTYKRIAHEVFWKGVRKEVTNFILKWQTWKEKKYETPSPVGLLSPLPIPQQIWSHVSMDFIEGLPRSKGFTVILVVVDRLSKYDHFIPHKHPFTSKMVAETFIKKVIKLHGFPKNILSDRDKIFLSQLWKELFQQQGTTLHRSTPYHPQMDG